MNPPIPYKEAAPLLGMTEIALLRKLNSRAINHVKIGRKYFMTERQIEDFIKEHTVPRRVPPGVGTF